MRVAVIRFPGSNCDLDMMAALKRIKGIEPVITREIASFQLTFGPPLLCESAAVEFEGNFRVSETIMR